MSNPSDVIDELIWQYSTIEQKLEMLRNQITKNKRCN